MHYIEELKNFVLLHSEAQQIDKREVKMVLSTILTEQDQAQNGWAQVWSKHAHKLQAQNQWSNASKFFNLARFPYIETTAQHDAHKSCIDNFKLAMHADKIKVEYLDLGKFKAYATGLDKGWPMLIVCGGIVSIKEQWQQFMHLSAKLKLAVVITEMPGVGENKQLYHPTQCTMFSNIIDALHRRADTHQTHLMALSFSGHLAILNAGIDPRIVGITTVGAPIQDFFSAYSKNTTPLVTQRTLAHLTQQPCHELDTYMQDWGLLSQNIPHLQIPVHYLQSTLDEIIPTSETQALRKIAPKLKVLKISDVHGSPNHMKLVAIWSIASIFSSFPARKKSAFILNYLLKLNLALHQLKGDSSLFSRLRRTQ